MSWGLRISNKAQPPRKSNLETMMESFLAMQTRQNKEFRNQNLFINGVLMQLTTKFEYIFNHNKMFET